MILKPKSIVVVYFKADWAKRANAEAVFGLPKENMPRRRCRIPGQGSRCKRHYWALGSEHRRA